MPHFYESVLIDTTDGLHCKSYSNEHPEGYIIVKPKYIPSDRVTSPSLKSRFIFNRHMTRLNLFSEKKNLINYLKNFKKAYPEYVYNSSLHNNWFFVVPKDRIAKAYNPKNGLQELMKVPKAELDEYLSLVVGLVHLLLDSGIKISDLGVTHSTLIGNYTYGKSDIDIVVYGKENGWKVLNFLETAKHPLLEWKSEGQWREYYKTHQTSKIFNEDEFVYHHRRKRNEGLFGNTVFTLFTVEEPNETWEKWGTERYTPLGLAKVQGIVKDNFSSIVRPGFYEIEDSKIIEGKDNVDVKRIVTYSLPFMLQAKLGEKIEACGLLERAERKSGEAYYRIVIGYFDAYTNERREKEYIKVI